MGEDKNYYLTQQIDNSGIAQVSNPATINPGKIDSPFSLRARPINVGQYFNNESQYDSTIGDVTQAVEEGRTVEGLRADNQDTLDMWGNALVNNVVIAGTTAVGGILGLADGIMESLYNWDASKMWDNTVNNTVTDIQNRFKESNPIYRPDGYSDLNALQRLGTGVFWAELFENAGFTEGMLVPGLAAGSLVRNAPKIMQKVVPSLTAAMSEASTEAINNRNDEIQAKTAILEQEYRRQYDNLVQQMQQSTDDNELTALGERLNQLDLSFQETKKNIEEDARKAGNFSWLANVALLTASNTIQWSNLFSRGFGTGRQLTGNLTRKGNEFIAPSIGSALTKQAGKKLLDGFTEFTEEFSQNTIGGIASNYTDYNTFNESIFNPEKRELATNLWSSLQQTFAEKLNDQDALSEGLSGFFTGILGVPMLKKGRIPVTLANNIGVEIYDTYKQVQRERELVDQINQRIQSDDKINAYYNGIVRHLVMQDRMNTAIDDADKYDFNTAQSAQMISDIRMFDEAGSLDYLKELVNDSIDMSDEGIDALIESTTKDGEGPFMFNGNPLSRDEVRDILKERMNTLNNKIEEYSRNKRILQAQYPNADKATIDNAVFLKGQIDDHSARRNQIIEESVASLNRIFKTVEVQNKTKEIPEGEGIYITINGKQKLVRKDDIDYYDENGEPVLKKNTINPYSNINLTTENFLQNWINPKFRQVVQAALNEQSALTYDQKTELATKLEDIDKITSSLVKMNTSLTEILINPNKSSQDAKKQQQQKGEEKRIKQELQDIESIRTTTVNDLARDIRNGEVDLNQMEDLIGALEGGDAVDLQQKVEDAKDLNNESNQLLAGIQEYQNDDLSAEELDLVKQDAQALVNAALEVSEDADQLKDLNREVYNDVRNLTDIGDPSVTPEFLQARLDAAKTILSEQIDELVAGLRAFSEMQNQQSEGQQEEQEIKETGHDPVAQVPSEQKRQQQNQERKEQQEKRLTPMRELITNATNILNNTVDQLAVEPLLNQVRAVATTIDKLTKEGLERKTTNDSSAVSLGRQKITSPEEILEYLNEDENYKNLIKLSDNFGTIFGRYIGQVLNKDKVTSQQPDSSNTIVERARTYNGPITPVENTTTSQYSQTQEENLTASDDGTYNFWRMVTSEINYYWTHGEKRPYYEEAKEITEAERKRLQVLWEYMRDNGVFERRNRSQMKSGDKVSFMIDDALNINYGIPVILIVDSNGQIIGDLPTSFDANYTKYVGLKEFTAKILEDWKNETNGTRVDDRFFSNYTLEISQVLVGKVPYSNTSNTLNEIAGGTPKLAIAMTDTNNGRATMLYTASNTKSNRTQDDERVKSPLKTVAGTPYFLIETLKEIRGKSQLIPVSFKMPKFGEVPNSTMDSAVREILGLIPTKGARAYEISFRLMQLLGIENSWIEFNNDNTVTFRIKLPNSIRWKSVLRNVPIDNVNLEDIVKALTGVPFQISKAYINSEYTRLDGSKIDYNRMIGEIATTNLPIGTNHTINDWFTIKLPEGKTTKFSSTRRNTTAATPRVPFAFKGSSYLIEPNGNQDYTIYTKDGNIYKGDNVNLIKAAYFVSQVPYIGSDGTILTNWGNYDIDKQEFVPQEPETSDYPDFNVPLPIEDEISMNFGDNPTETLKEATKALNEFKEAQASDEDQLADLGAAQQYLQESQQDQKSQQEAKKSEPKIGPKLSQVLKAFGTYYYANNISSLYKDYPLVPQELIDALEKYINEGAEFTEDQAQQFIDKANESLKAKRNSQINTDENADISLQDIEKTLKKEGIFTNTPRDTAIWNSLSENIKRYLYDLYNRNKFLLRAKKDPFKQVYKTLKDLQAVQNFFENKKFRIANNERVIWDKEKELSWLRKVLPQFTNSERLQIVKGLIKVSNNQMAYGQFMRGIITISDRAASGTVYHEAFHAVVNTLLSYSEQQRLFQAAKQKYGSLSNLELEERLAEDFRRYVQLEESPIIGTLVRLFRKLKRFVQNLLGQDIYLNKLYSDITNGHYSTSGIRNTEAVRNSIVDEVTILRQEINDIESRIEEQIQTINTQFANINKASTFYDFINGNTRVKVLTSTRGKYENKLEALEDFPQQYNEILIPMEDSGRWELRFMTEQEKENVILSLRQELQDAVNDLQNQIDYIQNVNEYQEESQNSQEEILDYNNQKFNYDNLTQEQKDYLLNLGISTRRYMYMTPREKEILFRCE